MKIRSVSGVRAGRAAHAAIAACALTMSAGALLGAACGDTSAIDDLTPRQVVVGAPTATVGESTSRFAFEVAISGLANPASPPGDVSITGNGAFDYDGRRGTMKTTIPAGSSTMTLDSVVIGTIVYQKLPAAFLQSTPAAGKPWIRVDLATLDASTGINLGTLLSAQSSDPTQAVALLRGAGRDVTEVGREDLRDDDVTHYRFTIDVDKALTAAGKGQRESLEQFANFFGDATIPADAWVDDDGRMRKLTYTLTRANFRFPIDTADPASQQAAGAKVTTTMELFDFGTEVKAEAPPADQVTDFAELMGSAVNQSG